VPFQPPHPTPPYSLRADSLQSGELEFHAEQPRMPKEWHTQSLGTKSFVETFLHVPMTMEIPMMMASPDTMLLTVPTVPLTSFITVHHHKHIKLNGLESHPVTQAGPDCCMNTQCNLYAMTWLLATNHHSMKTPMSKTKTIKVLYH